MTWPGRDDPYWITRAMDYLSDTTREDRYPADSGMPLTDYECEHGSLPQDTNIRCQCWHTPDMMEVLMAALNLKSEASKLYYCDNLECRTVNFKPEGHHPICPSCGGDGVFLRDPTVKRAGMRH